MELLLFCVKIVINYEANLLSLGVARPVIFH